MCFSSLAREDRLRDVPVRLPLKSRVKLAKNAIVFPASWVCSPARSSSHLFLVAPEEGLRMAGEWGAHQVEKALQKEVQQTGGAGQAALLADSLLHLPFSLKHFPPTNMMKFKTNITVKLSCQPWMCSRMTEEIAPSA